MYTIMHHDSKLNPREHGVKSPMQNVIYMQINNTRMWKILTNQNRLAF